MNTIKVDKSVLNYIFHKTTVPLINFTKTHVTMYK